MDKPISTVLILTLFFVSACKPEPSTKEGDLAAPTNATSMTTPTPSSSPSPSAPLPRVAKVTFRNKFYAIRDEDDGMGGNGVDIYFGWLVSGFSSSFGGSSEVSPDMTNNRGTGNGRNVYLQGKDYFTIEIPEGKTVAVRLFMLESDGTTDHIKERFASARPPVFNNENPPSLDVLLKATDGDAQAIYDSLKSTWNTDDDYGFAVYNISFINGKITASVTNKHEHTVVEMLSGSVLLDGLNHDIFGHNFKDGENDLGAVIEINAKEL